MIESHLSRLNRSGPSRILIIEDDPLTAYLLDNMVFDLGYTVSGMAHTIPLARQELAKRNFDAVLLDAELGGQKCPEIADLLQEMGIPFAFVTNRMHPIEVRHEAVQSLRKPFTAYQVCVALEGLVGPSRRTTAEMAYAT